MKKLLALFLVAGMFVVSSCASTENTESTTDTDTTTVAPVEEPATETPADTVSMPADSTGN
jgi:PBP1b-binding outer membrane lipoprotein LpoB